MSPEEVRLTRESLGLSMRKFAQLLDVNHRTVSNWENGRTSPPPMKAAVIRDLRKRARQEEGGAGAQELVESLLALAAGGAFGALLAKIYTDLSKDEDGE